jgi:hypothetical protein
MRTISEMAGIGYQNGLNKRKDDMKCEGFAQTQKYHGTTVKRSADYLKFHIDNNKSLYKEHILPTKHHIDILKKQKGNFVILIRDPDEVMDAYRRIFEVIKLDIDMKMLYNECRDFYNSYTNYKNKNGLIIEYKNLVLDFEKVIEQIFEHYNLEIKKRLNKLLKYNYTGVGVRRFNDICS